MIRTQSTFPLILATSCKATPEGYKTSSFQNQLNHMVLADMLTDDPDENDVELFSHPRIIRAHHKFLSRCKQQAAENHVQGTTPKITPEFIEGEIKRVCQNPRAYLRPGLHMHRLRMQLRIQQQLWPKQAA